MYYFLLALLSIVLIISIGVFLFFIFKQKRKSQIKNDYIYQMIHEIGTPLSTISLACEALAEQTNIINESSSQLQYINCITEESERMKNIVEQILLYAKLDARQLYLNFECFDIEDVIKDCISHCKLMFESKGGKIILQLDAGEKYVCGVRLHIGNVIINLLENASKYTIKKSIVTILTQNTETGLKISITDNGIGISKSEKKKIFKKYHRVRAKEVQNVKGYGMGLNYVKQVMEMHKGYVNVESEPGKGSTFILYFPKV